MRTPTFLALSFSMAFLGFGPIRAAADPARPLALRTVAKDCKAYVRPDEAALRPSWQGACEKGLASGLGVMKYLRNGQVESTFFGRLEDGR